MHTPATSMSPKATQGAKMLYLIKRRATTSRDELVAHWFANHMPQVIQRQQDLESQGEPHAHRYLVTLFDTNENREQTWDGMAQLWWDAPLPMPKVPHGITPTDTFQQKVVPYVPWATTEYVVIDGSEHLKVEPLTLNPPFPCTRSGFYKVSFLVQAKAGTDFESFYGHWLHTHVPNVKSVMHEVGGFRYVVSHSIDPLAEPYAGLAELYFHDEAAWSRFCNVIKPDGIEEWVDRSGTLVLVGRTEMIGLP
jgi:hypothetical protein